MRLNTKHKAYRASQPARGAIYSVCCGSLRRIFLRRSPQADLRVPLPLFALDLALVLPPDLVPDLAVDLPVDLTVDLAEEPLFALPSDFSSAPPERPFFAASTLA